MLKRISVDDLRPGMFVHELCGSWVDHPFWRRQFLIDGSGDIARLKSSRVRELWIDTARGADLPQQSLATAVTQEDAERAIDETLQRAITTHTTQAPASLHDELDRARRVVREAAPAVMSMFSEARLGRAVDVAGAQGLVERIRESMRRSPLAVLSVARLKQADEYTFMHSVAVSGLMIALAQQLQLPDHEVQEAGVAGLLHDLGKAQMPLSVLNKPGALTEPEFATMRRHPEAGHRMLANAGQVNDAVLDVVLHHHERVDGHGYPQGLPAERISRLAKMGALCDVYDAITSNRVYKRGWDPAVAVRKMAEWTGSHFDEALFQAFVKTVGIYPVGSLVRMASKRLGVVIDQNEGRLLAPRVRVFYSLSAQARIAPQVVDLSARGESDQIVGREDPEHWGFSDLDSLWQSP